MKNLFITTVKIQKGKESVTHESNSTIIEFIESIKKTESLKVLFVDFPNPWNAFVKCANDIEFTLSNDHLFKAKKF